MFATITGTLTANAIVKTVTIPGEDSKEVVQTSMALNDYHRNKDTGEWDQVTTFIRISIWRNPTIAQRLTSGSVVEVSGELQLRPYLNGNNEAQVGCNLTAFRVKVHHCNKVESGGAVESVTAGAEISEPADDLPF